MATERSALNDPQAEESLLGAMLLATRAIEVGSAIVTADDFYRPAHAQIFDAILTLHTSGEPVDVSTVSDVLRRADQLDAIGGPATLVNLQAATPATSNAARYAKIVAEYADLRRVQQIGFSIVDQAQELSRAEEIGEEAVSRLREIGIGRTDAFPHGVSRMADFLQRPEEARPPWIVPGIIRQGWRIIITAAEGGGKSFLLRSIAASTAAGIHCFATDQAIAPKKVLLVDLENPSEHIDLSMGQIQGACEASPLYDPDNLWLWHAPEGIDLRKRSDRAKFDNLLREVRPSLVCLGPVYKSYSLGARETDEIAVREVQATLDDLRTRHSFGLLMEHHAAKASGGSKRNLDPYGTVFWMRWPEIGLFMEPVAESEEVTLGRWRGDRLPNSWPQSLYRSSPWPWAGKWTDSSMPRGESVPVLSTSAPVHRRPPASDEF